MRKSLLLFLIALTSATTGGAQQSSTPPSTAGQDPTVVFGSEVNFVEVHAIVTDEKEAFVIERVLAEPDHATPASLLARDRLLLISDLT